MLPLGLFFCVCVCGWLPLLWLASLLLAAICIIYEITATTKTITTPHDSVKQWHTAHFRLLQLQSKVKTHNERVYVVFSTVRLFCVESADKLCADTFVGRWIRVDREGRVEAKRSQHLTKSIRKASSVSGKKIAQSSSHFDLRPLFALVELMCEYASMVYSDL